MLRTIFSLCLLAGACAATPLQLWVDDSSGTIAILDAVTGAVGTVGPAGMPLTDLAFSPSGDLFGITFGALYSVDQATGHATIIGSGFGAAPDGFVNSLVFSPGGVLYAADSSQLLTIDPLTGVASSVGLLGSGISAGGDLAFVRGSLYLADNEGRLDLVNPATGAATVVGSTGIVDLFGLASPDTRTLYGVAGTRLYTLNTTTGAATFVLDYAGQGFGQAFGQAFRTEAIPNPEPSALLLGGGGLLLIAGTRWISGRRAAARASAIRS